MIRLMVTLYFFFRCSLPQGLEQVVTQEEREQDLLIEWWCDTCSKSISHDANCRAAVNSNSLLGMGNLSGDGLVLSSLLFNNLLIS